MENIIETKSHWVRISVYTKYGNGNHIITYMWINLRWELRVKYSWYFTYRAALAQVQHPKAFIDFKWGNENPDPKTKKQLIFNQIRSRKAKITEMNNKLRMAQENYDELFPLEELPAYQKFILRKQRAENELKKLYEEYNKKM